LPLADKINSSKFLSPQAKLVFGLLINKSMTPREIADCVMSEPYELTLREVLEALEMLNGLELLEIRNFIVNSEGRLETRLIYTVDSWTKL
jgi:hypothetical protein